MRRLLAPFLALLLLTATNASAQVPPQPAEPEIWFNPHGPSLDLLNMWTDSAPWQNAAKQVKVLVLVHWWVAEQTDATLIQIRDFAAEHHMQIDLSTEPIAKFTPTVCGNEEGYMPAAAMLNTVQILQRNGFQVDWVDMDGSLQAGSYDPYPSGCHLAIPDLVTQVVGTLKYVVAAWPHVKIMEIEPLTLVTSVPTWRQDETAFHVGLAQTLGRPVRSMQSDVEWTDPRWKQAMLDVHNYTRQENLDYSVILDGSGAANSDASWVAATVADFEAIEGELHIIPEQVLFTSWSLYPLYNMPETSPTAQTWLINRYPRPRSRLQVQFVGQGAQGKLTTMDGKPIANATINGYQPGVVWGKPLPVTVVTGTVPATAVSALVGVRLNTECTCNGTNDVLFGTFSYQETQGGTARGSFTFPVTSANWNGVVIGTQAAGGTQVSRVIATPGKTFLTNSSAFPVTANAQYQFTVPAATMGGQGWDGNVILVFIDAKGNGTRVTVIPDPGKALVATATTAADGTFALNPMPRSVDGPNPVSVEFDGENGAYRSTVWTPLH